MAEVATKNHLILPQPAALANIHSFEASGPSFVANTQLRNNSPSHGSSKHVRVDSGLGRASDVGSPSITSPLPIYQQQTVGRHDREHAGHQPQLYHEPANTDATSRDGSHGARNTYHREIESQRSATRHIRVEDDEDEDDHARWILFWLSCLDPFFCLFTAALTVITVIVVLICYPFRFCRLDFDFGTPFIRTVAPVFRQHLKLLCAPSLDQVHTFQFSVFRLILVNITSPVVSMGIALASWFTAAFWLFSLMMGNPDGTERKDDGKEAILSLRNWWERWLLSAVKR